MPELTNKERFLRGDRFTTTMAGEVFSYNPGNSEEDSGWLCNKRGYFCGVDGIESEDITVSTDFFGVNISVVVPFNKMSFHHA